MYCHGRWWVGFACYRGEGTTLRQHACHCRGMANRHWVWACTALHKFCGSQLHSLSHCSVLDGPPMGLAYAGRLCGCTSPAWQMLLWHLPRVGAQSWTRRVLSPWRCCRQPLPTSHPCPPLQTRRGRGATSWPGEPADDKQRQTINKENACIACQCLQTRALGCCRTLCAVLFLMPLKGREPSACPDPLMPVDPCLQGPLPAGACGLPACLLLAGAAALRTARAHTSPPLHCGWWGSRRSQHGARSQCSLL